jgi:sugar phosphate isomerase/epimerase
MRDFSRDHRWLSINTATVRRSRGVELPLPAIIEACVRKGIRAISPWRDQVQAAGLAKVSQLVRAHGLELSGYCRGGMFPAADAAGLQAARDDNRRAVDEAAELRAPCLVLVVGGLPGALQGKAAHKDIALARTQVRDGIAELLDYAKQARMPLAIEPLHPMYAADRACVNTVDQALDMAGQLGEGVGVAIDVYHVWWDPNLSAAIARAGSEGRIYAHHICDWLVPTTDMLLDRGMMGDGVIDLTGIRAMIEDAGYHGPQEVEIFSRDNWWKRPGDEVVRTCVERFNAVC